MKKQNKVTRINPFILVILSFLGVILLGSVLLCFPFCNVWGKWLWNTTITEGSVAHHYTYIDSLFTAVSATCVTGVSTYHIGFADSLTFVGQLITFLMVQIGGLGFITILTFIITLIKSKLQFKDRLYISTMVSATSFADVVKFLRKIILITFIFEGIGFLLGLPVFLTMYSSDPLRALWNSLFHSISAFNNAGFDLFSGTTSFIGSLNGAGCDMVIDTSNWLYYYFCSYIMILIICGGISFLVIIELFTTKKNLRHFSLFSKSVIITSFILILGGAISIWLADGFKSSNPISFFDALFQSVTCRTAGFATYKPDNLSLISKIISCFLMFVGGAPLGTAGGIKVTTLFVIVVAIYSYIKGRKVTSFNRFFSSKVVIKGMTLAFIGLVITIIGFIALNGFGFDNEMTYSEVLGVIQSENPDYIIQNTGELEAYVYEIYSCFGTTGFFVGFEPYLSSGSKIVLCLLMFLGRLGPMTFFQIFAKNIDQEDTRHYKLVEEDVLIG